MKYQAPYGSSDDDASYVDRNTPGAVSGSKVPAAAIEHPQREIAALIAAAGLTPSASDLGQMVQAVRSGALNYAIAGGTANALTATLTPPLTAHVAGLPLRLKITKTNTGAATLNAGPGALSIVTASGTALSAGDLTAGTVVHLVCTGSAWVLQSSTSPAAATETVSGIVELATGAETAAGTDATRAVTPAGLLSRTASSSRSGLVELATSTETIAGTDAARAVTPAGMAAVTATEDRAGLIELATVDEAVAGTDGARAVTPVALAAVTATDGRAGLIELATGAETAAGTDATRAVTPAGLLSRTATSSRSGLVELATSAETIAGTDAERAVTPAGLAARAASLTQTGLVELATADEAIAGTDATRAVTPAALAAVTATEARAGLIELATGAETAIGTDTSRAVTPASLLSRTATGARIGLVELATPLETSAGTDGERAVTPLGLAYARPLYPDVATISCGEISVSNNVLTYPELDPYSDDNITISGTEMTVNKAGTYLVEVSMSDSFASLTSSTDIHRKVCIVVDGDIARAALDETYLDGGAVLTAGALSVFGVFRLSAGSIIKIAGKLYSSIGWGTVKIEGMSGSVVRIW